MYKAGELFKTFLDETDDLDKVQKYAGIAKQKENTYCCSIQNYISFKTNICTENTFAIPSWTNN